MAKKWYRLKLVILDILIYLVSEKRFLIYKLDEDRAKSLEDTGEWNIPRMVLVERVGCDFTYVGAGVFSGWHMFYAERS